MSDHRLAKLETNADWSKLTNFLDPTGKNDAVKGVISQLRAQDALSAIIELNYLDQDFTAVYSAFYATVFRRHTKTCKRLHFFKEDITTLIDDAHPERSARSLEDAGQRSYLGFIVARPISHAPLGRVVLGAPVSPAGMHSELLVHAPYQAHVLGATLRISGMAMTQQDSRVGACAQAAMWMAGRHFFMKNHGPWFSTVAITEAATKVSDHQISKSLPAGSEFLTPDNMVRGLRSMGREPLIYVADSIVPGNRWQITWNTLKPHAVISRYIDSGIPVIIGLAPFPGGNVGHAVVAIGQTIRQLPPNSPLPNDPTYAEFCEAFIVNDDQRGANLRLATSANGLKDQSPYLISENVLYLIVPLPKKVLMPAEQAETISWASLKQYQGDWLAHKAAAAAILGGSMATGDQFIQNLQDRKVIARTYLTHGWKYKERMLRNSVGKEFKSILYYHDLPKFVWVTEFGTFDSLNCADKTDRKIFAHSVIDATASKFWETRSIFHAPGMSVRFYHDDADPFGQLKNATAVVSDDAGYDPKVRRT